MTRSCLLLGAVTMALFCPRTAEVVVSNDDIDDSVTLQQMKDIVFDTVHHYFQELKKLLAPLRKYVGPYLREYRRAIRTVVRNLGVRYGIIQESSVEDRKEMHGEYDDYITTRLAQERYDQLCRGEISLSEKTIKKLKCRYTDRGIPFLKIAPLKEEEAYLNPRIVLYHDVLYEEEIEVFKKLSLPKLKTAQVINTTTGQGKDSTERIAKSGWLDDSEEKHVELVSRRVEHMTKLAVDTAEDLQVAYYEIGGLYLPHFDYIPIEDLPAVKYFTETGIGNRIATVLFYMNEVDGGGATVFTQLDLTIWPKKGSAVFWYNLKRNGKTDALTRHGACPVLFGTKWIVTKWLHEGGQEFTRPCSLSKNE